jgi:hypothetical protein
LDVYKPGKGNATKKKLQLHDDLYMPKKVNGYLYSDTEVIAADYQAEEENNLLPDLDD